MKVIINESRLKNLVRSYIIQTLGEYTPEIKPYGSGNHYEILGFFDKDSKNKSHPAIIVVDLSNGRWLLAVDSKLLFETYQLFFPNRYNMYNDLTPIYIGALKEHYGLDIDTIVAYDPKVTPY